MRVLLLPLLLFVFFSASLSAQQVPRQAIVEHFTNTRCSVCGSRNPGFYQNLWQHPQVWHLAVHPSSPYANCVVNQYNAAGNDARTNWYGVYGATPRLVLQGNVIPANANYNDPALFAPYLGQYSSFAVRVSLEDDPGGFWKVTAVVKKVDTSSLQQLSLFGALTQDTLFYQAPNGESVHYDVFRSSVWGVAPFSLTVPAAVGDSVVVQQSVPKDPLLPAHRLYALVLLQDPAKAIVNAGRSGKLTSGPVSVAVTSRPLARLFPNPARDQVQVQLPEQGPWTLSVSDAAGRVYDRRTVYSTSVQLNTDAYGPGIYLIRVSGAGGAAILPFVKVAH